MRLANLMVSVMKSILALLLLINGPAQAIACGYHQATPQFLNAPHPTTYVIAVALRKAADEKRLTLINPNHNSKGYFNAVGKLEAFSQRLKRTMQDLSPERPSLSLSIVFIDVTLWSRIVIKDGDLTLQPHVKGAAPGDVVVSTAESVLAAMLYGKLSFQEAMNRGLIHIEGPDTEVANVKRMIASSIRPTNRVTLMPTRSVDQTLKQKTRVAILPRNK